MSQITVAAALAAVAALAQPAFVQSAFAQSAPAQPSQGVSFAQLAGAPAGGAIAIPVGTDGALAGLAAEVDIAAGGAVARAIAAAKFKGGVDDSLVLHAVGPYDRIALIGVGAGPQTSVDLENYGGRAAAALGEAGGRIAAPDAADVAEDAAAVAFGAQLRSYNFGEWGSERAKTPNLTVLSANPSSSEAAWRSWSPVAAGVSLTRDLISTPSNVKSPEWFVAQVRARTRGMRNVTVEALDVPAMQRLGMGALLSVGAGSTRPPRLLVVRYRGGGTAAPVAFVGKGITFDSGGLSLKEPAGMWRMRYDMAGAAAAVSTVIALAERGAQVNAVGIAALAENMPDGGAARPGDVVTAMNGKTVEILNTDAEGRLVLADGMTYAQRNEGARTVFTIATLTGSARAALGDDYAALLTRDEGLARDVDRAAAAAGEPVWRLPAHESTSKALKGTVADVMNVIEGGAEPGASVGAAFLMEFVEPDVRFAHLDIAGVAWTDRALPTVPSGAVGYGVRLFDRLVRDGYEPR